MPKKPKQKAWHKNDELFKKELEKGHFWQTCVATFLKEEGLEVEAPGLEIRDQIQDAFKFINTKDLIAAGEIIEVKSRNLSFTSGHDYPYKTIFIDTVSGWEAKKPKPFAYVMVSQITGCMIWTPGNSKKGWTVTRNRDRVRRIEVINYESPSKEWLNINLLVNLLKSRSQPK